MALTIAFYTYLSVFPSYLSYTCYKPMCYLVDAAAINAFAVEHSRIMMDSHKTHYKRRVFDQVLYFFLDHDSVYSICQIAFGCFAESQN